MTKDIFQKIEKDFGKDAKRVHKEFEILDAKTNGQLFDRLIRAIVYLAKGDIDKLKMYIEMSQVDWRDVLWQAEYDSPDDPKRYRDFNKSFHDLGLY